MGKPSPEKNQRRREKVAKKRKRTQSYFAKKEVIASFPPVIFEENNADPHFIQAVRDGMRTIVARHDALLPKWVCQCFHEAKRNGFASVIKKLRSVATKHGLPRTSSGQSEPEVILHFCLGELLFKHLHEGGMGRFFPFNDASILMLARSNTILVRTTSLRQVKRTDGKAYFSQHEPKVTVDGREYSVAFSRHAAERICERTVCDWHKYADYGTAFVFLNECKYYEPCELADGQRALVLYNECAPSFFTHQIAAEVLGDLVAGERYAYRVGYCPVVVDKKFLVATTLLTPGMTNTPEYADVIWPMGTTHEQRQLLRELVSRLSFRGLAESRDFELLRLFQSRSVPQVIRMEQELFVNPTNIPVSEREEKTDRTRELREQILKMAINWQGPDDPQSNDLIRRADMVVCYDPEDGSTEILVGEDYCAELAATEGAQYHLNSLIFRASGKKRVELRRQCLRIKGLTHCK